MSKQVGNSGKSQCPLCGATDHRREDCPLSHRDEPFSVRSRKNTAGASAAHGHARSGRWDDGQIVVHVEASAAI